MPTIFEIADHVLAISPVGLSNKELQKLLYLAQGFHLAQTGQELFVEDFAAWRFGPVHSGIFHKYKKYGYQLIDRPKADVCVPVDEQTKVFLAGLLLAFSAVGQNNLIEYSHADVPWSTKYIPDQNVQLSKTDLREYFVNFASFEEYKTIADHKVKFHKLIDERVKYLKRLPEIGNAWISGKAEAPSEEACNVAQKFLAGFERYLFSSDAKPTMPGLIMGPIPSGGISIEFHAVNSAYLNFYNSGKVELEFERDGSFEDLEVPSEQFEENFLEYYSMVAA
ncbi:hypothetical protein D3C78_92180 [compost metagenome]